MTIGKHGGSLQSVQHGMARGKQRSRGQECGRHCVEGAARVRESLGSNTALTVTLSRRAKAAGGRLGTVCGVARAGLSLEQGRGRQACGTGRSRRYAGDGRGREGALAQKNTQQLWSIKAVDRRTGRPVAWVPGGRDAATFRRLDDKGTPLQACRLAPDAWEACATRLPPERPRIGQTPPVAREWDHRNTRPPLGRMTRRTKVVATKACMVHASRTRWLALTTPHVFARYQEKYLRVLKYR